MARNPSQSILQTLREAMDGDKLPRDYNLLTEDGIRMTDGAQDGLYLSSNKARSVGQQALRYQPELAEIYRELQHGETENAFSLTQSLNAACSTVLLLQLVQEMFADMPPAAGRALAMRCLWGTEPETVKFGLLLMSLLPDPDSLPLREIVILGCCNEFTLYALFCLRRCRRGNGAVFGLAKRVYGWGRIHAVEALRPETRAIRNWLLAEGCRNDIMPQYSAKTVYEKADIRSLLMEGRVYAPQFEQIAFVLGALLAERGVPGIRAVEDPEPVLEEFLRQAEYLPLTLGICEVVYVILQTYGERFETRCQSLLRSSACRRIVKEARKEGKAAKLAAYLGLAD